MNHAHIPAHSLRHFPSATALHHRRAATQFIPDAPPPHFACLSPMGTMKLLLSAMLLASAMTLTEIEEWRLFGGLLAGGVIGGLVGVLLAALTAKRVPWQVYAARFAANVLGTLGLGAIGLYLCIYTFGMHAGPFLTVGNGFVFGLIGVGAFKATLEKRLLNRLARLAGEEMESQSAATVTGTDAKSVQAAPSPPTVNLTLPQPPPPKL